MGKRLLLIALLTVSGAALSEVSCAQETVAQESASVQPDLQAAGRGYTVLDLLQKGGPVMYPLYLCSVLMVAFWVERAISLRRKRIIPAEIQQALRDTTALINGTDRAPLLDQVANASPMGRIIKAALRKAGRPAGEMEKAIEDAGAKEVAWLQRNNKVFAVVASIAPLLGLLGTVTGLMRSFSMVAASSQALGRMELMAAGIYEALVTTVVGLAIAIPAMALYFYYQDRVDQLVRDIDSAAEEFLEKFFAETRPGS